MKLAGMIVGISTALYIASFGWHFLLAWSVLVAQIGLLAAIAVYLIRWRKQVIEERRILAINNIRAMDSFEFEKRVGLIYEKLGYKIEMRGGQSDNGIDLILRRGACKFAVQVKRYSERNLVGEPALREFYGSFVDEFDAGVFVTTSSFTYQAKKMG